MRGRLWVTPSQVPSDPRQVVALSRGDVCLFLVEVTSALALLTLPCPPPCTLPQQLDSIGDSPCPVCSTRKVSPCFPPLRLAANFPKEECHTNSLRVLATMQAGLAPPCPSTLSLAWLVPVLP